MLIKVETKDGKTYFFGDALNQLLAEAKYPVWTISAAGAHDAGCGSFPNLIEIFEHNVSAVGTEAFGKPRVPEEHTPHQLPIDYVRDLWPVLKPQIVKFCPEPQHWPVLMSSSIQEVIGMGKSMLDPCIAITLVMETAIPMSKVDLSTR